MVSASFMQTSFLGGEWSPSVQGRMDSERYKTALNVCQNYYPIEEGPLVRRQGTQRLGPLRSGGAGRTFEFDYSASSPYQVLMTDGYLRMVTGTGFVLDGPANTQIGTVSTISSATPAKVALTGSLPAGWATGDTFLFSFPTALGFTNAAKVLCNRQFVITKTSSTEFTIADALTGAGIDGTTLSDGTGALVVKIFEVTTPYTGTKWSDLQLVQDDTTAVFLRSATKPYSLTASGSNWALAAAVFKDGPYLDAPNTNGTGGSVTSLTPSATTGTITVTASNTTDINSGQGFLSTDVGRMIRLWSQPAAFDHNATYAIGDTVTFENVSYTAIKSVAAHTPAVNPPVNLSSWAPVADAAFWSWGTITVVTDTTHVTVALSGHDLVNTSATVLWRLGLYCDTLGWPTCGTFHEGRLWLSGVVKNRVDGSKSNDHFNFSPTGDDGTVADDNGVAATFTSKERVSIFWMATTAQGLVAGTEGGEWRIRASNLDDPITPSSIQARRATTFQAANIEAVQAPRSLLFVQRKQRKIIEYGFQENNYWNNQAGTASVTTENLSISAAHLASDGIAEIRWQNEPHPCLWARTTKGTLLGMSFKHDQETMYVGWHKHPLGSGGSVESLGVSPSVAGTENVYVVVNDGSYRWLEMLTNYFDESIPDWQQWFADSGIVPCEAKVLQVANGDAIDGVRFYGLWPLAGQSATPVIGGLDLGPWPVQADGTLDVAFLADPDKQFTAAYLNNLSSSGINWGGQSLQIAS